MGKRITVEYAAQLQSIFIQIRVAPGVERLRALSGGETFDYDMVEAVLREAAKFSAFVLAPLNRVMDREGCRLLEGRVVLAPGHEAAWRSFCAGGWTGIDLAEAHSGQGLPALFAVAAQELFDRGAIAFGMVSGAARSAARLLESHADEATKAEWLPRLATGEWGATICMSESGAGSDVGRIRTRAHQGDDGVWRIVGEKIWISFADHPLTERIGHLVLARSEADETGLRGLSLFLVPAGRASEARNGVVIRRVEKKLGLHGSPTCAVGFEESAGSLIGSRGRGVAQLFRMIIAMRLQVGTQGLGLATAAYEIALDYARERLQGGSPDGPAVPIIQHADVRRALLDMASRIETLRGLIYTVAVAADLADLETDPTARQKASALLGWLLPIVKNSAAEIGFEISAQAILVLGGAGYSAEWPLEQYLRDARILAIYEGTTGMQAIDLVKRRLLSPGGEFEIFLATASADSTHLSPAAALAFRAGMDALQSAATWLRAPERTQIDIDAAASPMLSLATAAAHLWIAARLTRLDSAAAGPLIACGHYAVDRFAEQARALELAVTSIPGGVQSYADVVLY
jgi:3-(methylthio)propanoyl-CoA dehydrogenase